MLKVKDETVPKKGVKGVRGRKKTSCKARSGRGCNEDVEIQELEEVSRGYRCLQVGDWRGKDPSWAVALKKKKKKEES